MASASSNSSTPLTPSASAKTRSRFFSVSPTYLSTTVARLTAYRSRPSAPAITSADMVLPVRSEEHTSELQSRGHLVCRLLLEKKNTTLLNIEFLTQTKKKNRK